YNIATAATKHLFLGDEVIATITGTGATAQVQYALTDHLSGSSVVTNATGTIIELMDYYPFGDIRLDRKTTTFSEQRKFIGQEYDVDTGLSYLNARYLNGKMGRFVSQDPAYLSVGTKQFDQRLLSNPQVLNSYSYAFNNPIRISDPDGKFPPALIALGAAALLYAPQASMLAYEATMTPVGQLGASQIASDANEGRYGWAAFGAFATVAGGSSSAGRAAKYVPTFDGLWSIGRQGIRSENAIYHAQRAGSEGIGHAAQFGLRTTGEYIEKTREFITNAINRNFSAKLETGNKFDTLRTYDQSTNTFSSFEVNKATNAVTPRTMFKPDGGINYFNNSNLNPGRSINLKNYFTK
ncbi:MAG: hypothetical protein RL141_132, partial [Candidatus Parcubacteria bacterium]